MSLSPLARRRLANFRSHKRGYRAFWIFITLFAITLPAEFIANDQPLLIRYDGSFYVPMVEPLSEQFFGGEFASQADYTDPFVQNLIEQNGWLLFPPIPMSYDTIDFDLQHPTPSPPDSVHWLGTDDQGRDVLARLIYGFRISVLFGLLLTMLSYLIGILSGALQGYFGGAVDLVGQRLVEIWSGLPVLFLLILLSAFIAVNFWWLLIIMAMFNWIAIESVVRAEFLKARQLVYVRAAVALGVPPAIILFRHILPNAMVAALTFLPFVLSGAITTLTSLDFLGFGLPPGSPSLGEMLQQGKNNLHAPWLGLTAFFVIAVMLTLLIFIGEAVRAAFDPRRSLPTNATKTKK